MDRLRLLDLLDDKGTANLRKSLFSLFRRIEWVSINESVLQLAEGSFPTKIASLDAIHLSSAILLKRKYPFEIVFTSHEQELLVAAQAAGFDVRG
ncbi:MAG: hypothetical protein HYR96_01815 [Deltaproteobacteria bacterium]|nr:hypothetical protein [Deltaproteobacteria bacterium]MBI3295803.1 hypothetical protein [Deltaproteobacteria bacterium]